MRIICLVENTAPENLGCAHGLSIYIETAKHKILFDAGPNGELLKENAANLGVDLRDVDIAILSHGHYDHAGGLEAFLELNSKAKLYMHKLAKERGHFATENVGWRNIGIDKSIIDKYGHRIILTDSTFEIDDELFLFSDIKTSSFLSGSNSSLFEENNGEYYTDPFNHEQNLIINYEGKYYLIAGCAHRGIYNIISRANELCGEMPSYVVSGFHLTNPGLGIDLPEDFVRSLGKELKNFPCKYFTGHCTGKNPYSWLKDELENSIDYLHAGKSISI